MSRQSQPSSSFLLVCSLCPNRRPFSDISHCLTHLNSKGHLQSKHKVELQATADHSAQAKLDAYNLWYTTNDIARLLTERMRNTKGSKKSAKRKSGNSNGEINPESTEFPQPIPSNHLAQPASGEFGDDNSWGQDPYGTPKTTRQVPGFTPIDPRLNDTPNDPNGDKAVEGKGKGGGPLELKGERYEGMSVFDSATPNTKRTRNQRKGPEVLRQMMKNALEVEPEEVSYHASGEFRSARNIYGPLSTESSPVQKLPTPKRRRSVKPVLQLKSANRHVRTTKPPKFEALSGTKIVHPNPYKNFPVSTKHSMALQLGYDDTNYLNPDMASKFDVSGPTRNPFMATLDYDLQNVLRKESSGFKQATHGSTITKTSPAPLYEDELERMFSEPYQYTSPGFLFGQEEKNRDQVGTKSLGNPLSAAYVQGEGRSESSLEEPRFVFPEHTLGPSFNHLNEAGLPQGSPTPVARPVRINGSRNEVRPSYPAQKPHPVYTSPKPLPKVGIFRDFQGGTQSRSEVPSRKIKGPRHTPSMTTQLNRNKKDYVSSRQASSRQFESGPIHSSNSTTTAGSRQHRTPVPKQHSHQASSANTRNFDAFQYSDEDGNATPRTSFRPVTSSAMRLMAPSPAQSTSHQWARFSPRSGYGADLEGEYNINLEDQFSL